MGLLTFHPFFAFFFGLIFFGPYGETGRVRSFAVFFSFLLFVIGAEPKQVETRHDTRLDIVFCVCVCVRSVYTVRVRSPVWIALDGAEGRTNERKML